MKTKQEGFTLIELLVVIAIIAILAISITVGYQSVRKSAANAKRVEIARSIATAEELYYNANKTYTNDIDDLISDGYLSSNPNDSGISPEYDDSIDDGCRWDDVSGCSIGYVLRGNSSGFAVRPRLDNGSFFCCNTGGCVDDVAWNECPLN
jgi:prepilin-type N-terminal cleavage/methylation domain-containing protein